MSILYKITDSLFQQYDIYLVGGMLGGKMLFTEEISVTLNFTSKTTCICDHQEKEEQNEVTIILGHHILNLQ